jgi:GTP-binding protein LepA
MNACEGALLLVDAVKGVQAQTVANWFLAIGNNLKILPVVNKVRNASHFKANAACLR